MFNFKKVIKVKEYDKWNDKEEEIEKEVYDIPKIINKDLTGDKFVDRDLDNYIYASLTQPPIKIIDKNESDDELDFTVECPSCHRPVNYGKEIFMVSGHIYCSDENCKKKVYYEVGINDYN